MAAPWYDVFFGSDYARFDHHPHTAQEVGFLRAVLANSGLPEDARVLDLACGMGRHSAPLSRAGYGVIGVDRSPAMLARARRRRSAARWVRGDMSRVPLAEGSCDAVVSMFSSFGYFEDEAQNYRVLAEIARLLRPGGIVIIETVSRDFFIRHAPPQSWFTKDGLTVLEARTFDAVASRSEVDVVVQEGHEQRAYHHSIRLYTAAELAMLLASVEIDVFDVVGDFDASELTVDSPRLIVVAEKR